MPHSEYTVWNVLTYLSLCFVSIALLVFLNSTQPFVLEDVLGLTDDVGRKVGSLAFADESVSMILCPLWGALSDKIGTRPVAAAAFSISAIALALYTHGSSFFPDLLLLRVFFAVGGSAATAMITAILAEASDFDASAAIMGLFSRRGRRGHHRRRDTDHSNHYSPLLQPEPQLLLTERRNGKLVGLVGLCTGLGALTAVSLLLPLPALLSSDDYAAGLQSSYYIVAGVAALAGVIMTAGLHRDRTKSIGWLVGRPASATISVFDQAALNLVGNESEPISYIELLKKGFGIAAQDRQIALGYVGGFVARSATIATTMFIPLTVKSLGVKGHDAYILAAVLSGMANLFALVFAPLWGYLSDAVGRSPTLMVSTVCGFIGSIGFGAISNPRSPAAFVMASFLGAAQIGVIVTSMSFCTDLKRDYSGSIAGVYSFFGGLGILCISSVGGYLADFNHGMPFFILSAFYVVLFFSTLWTIRDQVRGIAL